MTGAHYYDVEITGAVAASQPAHWTARRHRQCTWPIGEGAGLESCCAPVEARDGSWCAAHIAAGRLPTDDGPLRIAVAQALGAAGEKRAQVAETNRALAAIPPGQMARVIYLARERRAVTAQRRAA